MLNLLKATLRGFLYNIDIYLITKFSVYSCSNVLFLIKLKILQEAMHEYLIKLQKENK